MATAMPLSGQDNPPSAPSSWSETTWRARAPSQEQGEGSGGRGAPAPHFGIAQAPGRSRPAQLTFPGCAWPADAAQPGWVPLGDIHVTAGVIFFGVCSSKHVK